MADLENLSEKLYPIIHKPSAPDNNYIEMETMKPNSHRINYVNDIIRYLENQSETRKKINKKYNRLTKGLHYANYGLNTLSTISTITSASLAVTIGLLPVSVAVGSVAASSSVLSIIISKINKKFKKKEQKHRDIYNLAKNKLSLLHSLYSKFMNDGILTQEEFDIILKEEKHYRVRKEELRRNNDSYDENTVKEKGKTELKESLLEPINKLVTVINKK